MKKITIHFLILFSLSTLAQERLSTTKGIIHFEASVPLFEEVKATNQEVICEVELKTSEINCTVFIEKFQFKRELMRTHFNDNYFESHRYPKATFIGRIDKFDYKSLSDQPTQYHIKGIIKIHGKSKLLSCDALIKKVNKGMELNTSFILNTDDFNIRIPSIVASKISKQVITTLKTTTTE